jgi:hypothetical protein
MAVRLAERRPRPARDSFAAVSDLGSTDTDVKAAQRRCGVRLVRAAGRLDLQGRYVAGPWTWTMPAAERKRRVQVDADVLARVNQPVRALQIVVPDRLEGEPQRCVEAAIGKRLS